MSNHLFLFLFFLMVLAKSSNAEPVVKYNFNSEPLGQPAKPEYSIPTGLNKVAPSDENLVQKVKLQLHLLGFWHNKINNESSDELEDALKTFCESIGIKTNECNLNNEKMLNMLGVQRFVK